MSKLKSTNSTMDYVLMDIKNFLKKLESGQLEIEAGQWELHKDIANVKKAVEELKELKDDLEKMRLSSVQQLGLIKSLQEKIDLFKDSCKSSEPVTESESTMDYEKIYKRSSDEQGNPKGYKKRKFHIIRSEEAIEITSEASDDSNIESKTDEIKIKEADESGETSEREDSRVVCRKRSQVIQPQPKVKPHNSLTSNNKILQRYLKDSAKYKDNKEVEESKLSCRKEVKGADRSGNTPFWDEYRAPTKETFSKRTSESVIPRRLACPKCPRKFTYKAHFLRHEKKHRRAKAKFICHICGKGFCRKDRLKRHNLDHRASSRISKGYMCSYCDKVCSTPEKLTTHLRECRTIKRSRFRRNNF